MYIKYIGSLVALNRRPEEVRRRNNHSNLDEHMAGYSEFAVLSGIVCL